MMETRTKPVRVLQINSGSGNFGGVSSFLYNVYTHIDRDAIQFDFLSPNKTTYGIRRKEIEALGGRIHELGIEGNLITRKLKLYARLKRFLREHPYSIVHLNSGNFFFNLVAARAIRAAKVRTLIVHSHNAGDTSRSRLKKAAFCLLKPILERQADDLYACSIKAAEYMFTRRAVAEHRVSVIRNGIDLSRFAYSEEKRRALRKELGLEDSVVVGHVGRFLAEKNHEYLIRVFSDVHRRERRAVLLLFGGGEREERIRRLVAELGLRDCVRFMGVVSNIEDMYQIMDVFVMPSIHEGLPVTCIELQTNGLPCLLADTITEEVRINDNVRFLSLDDGESKWGEAALALAGTGHHPRPDAVREAGYAIEAVARDLEDRYLKML